MLAPLLRKRGVIIKDEEVAYVLDYYEVKKTNFEPAINFFFDERYGKAIAGA
jgi:hypothetical protein